MNNPQLACALVIVVSVLLLAGLLIRVRRAKLAQRKEADERARRNVWRNASIHGALVAREEAASRNCK